jgi:hypothetical protein
LGDILISLRQRAITHSAIMVSARLILPVKVGAGIEVVLTNQGFLQYVSTG